MIENRLQKVLGKQFLIAAYIETKLQIVNYIKEGYDSNKPILINNRFLHFTAHTYYRSIVVDLFALFGPANSHNKNSFRHFNLKYEDTLNRSAIKAVEEWIDNADNDIRTIMLLRHKQIAHYDFEQKESISLNFDHLSQINSLFELAKRIIIHLGHAFLDEEIRIGYDFERKHQYLESLERLIAKAAHP